MKLLIKKLNKEAFVPERAHVADAGIDLCAVIAYEIQPGERVQVSTGIAMHIPEEHVGLIWDKSGLSHKGGLKVLGGVVDNNYRGEIIVGIINLSDCVYRLDVGHKVAQILIQRYETPEIVVVDDLEDSERGERGFGSTGK